LADQNIFLVSAIAQPDQFEKLVSEHKKVRVVGHFKLPDHAVYTVELVGKIQAAAREARAKFIVVTEKDAVKLKGVDFNFPVLVSHLQLSAPELVDAVLSRISR